SIIVARVVSEYNCGNGKTRGREGSPPRRGWGWVHSHPRTPTHPKPRQGGEHKGCLLSAIGLV
ncbi:MAG: hypothetical protein L3K26_01870, partial [Candidatus Hydrogenedentes bacterium]|nr:hypothetical protein [Candidatus Hydrogenedentota bacterium]